MPGASIDAGVGVTLYRGLTGNPNMLGMLASMGLPYARLATLFVRAPGAFAPSILREHVGEWFEAEDDIPFMMQAFQIRPEKRPLIPAITHVDGSGRLQTVHRETNPRYYRLIEAFRALTGVPMVLNASFNENEPVVCKPEEALDCFLRTRMDVLVLGNTLIALADYSK